MKCAAVSWNVTPWFRVSFKATKAAPHLRCVSIQAAGRNFREDSHLYLFRSLCFSLNFLIIRIHAKESSPLHRRTKSTFVSKAAVGN